MQLLQILAILAAAIEATSAATVPKKFHLKTQTYLGPNGHPDYNDLYVAAYHTGAGFNTAALQNTTSHVGYSTLDPHGIVSFHFHGVKYPYHMDLVQPADTYSGWAPTEINVVTGGTRGFEFNQYGYLVNKNRIFDFGGWRVCEWVHGYPELFHNLKGYNLGLPKNCNQVNIVAVPVA